MKETRPLPLVFTTVFILGGLAATIGCGGNPEEGTLKLPPRQGVTPEAAKPATSKGLPTAKARKAAEEAAGGK